MAEYLKGIMEGIRQTKELNDQCIGKLDKDMELLRQYLTELSAMWEGPAHDIWHNEVMADIENLETIIVDLKKIAAYEGEAHKQYSNANQKSEDLITRI